MHHHKQTTITIHGAAYPLRDFILDGIAGFLIFAMFIGAFSIAAIMDGAHSDRAAAAEVAP